MSLCASIWQPLTPHDCCDDATVVNVFRVSLAADRFNPHENWSELTDAERSRGSRYVVEPPRRRFLLCRRALRRCLAWLTQSAAKDIVLAAEVFGKPFLSSPAGTGIDFNVTHSGDWGIIAVARDCQVGVDLEVIDPQLDIAGLASRFFSDLEQQALLACPEPLQRAAFYRIWNTKEAYLKALGVGMSLPLGSFSVAADPESAPAVIAGDLRNGPWYGAAFSADDDSPGVILWNGTAKTVKLWEAPQGW